MSIALPIKEDQRFRRYTASTGQTVFSIPFPFQQAEDILIYLSRDGKCEPITRSAFTITGAMNPMGGSLTFNSERFEGDIILIVGDAILDRLSSIVRDGKFASKLTDDELDRNRIIQQEQQRDINRSIKAPYGSQGATLTALTPSSLLHIDYEGNISASETPINEKTLREEGDKAIASLVGQAGPIEVGFYDTRFAAELANIKATSNVILVGGGDAPGDGDAAWYMRVASDGDFQSLDGSWWQEFPWNGIKTTVKNWGATSIPRSVGDKLRDYCSIEDYGGGVDKTGSQNVAAFEGAKTAIASQFGVGCGPRLLFQTGAYKISEKLTLGSGMIVEGQGQDISRLVPMFNDSDIINIGDGISVTQHSTFRGFSLEPDEKMIAGAAIRFRNHFSCHAEHIRAPSDLVWGIAIDNGAVSYIARLKDIFVNAGEFGLAVGQSGVGDVQNVDLADCQFGQNTGAGIALFNVGGIFIDNTECLSCTTGLLTYPGPGRRVNALRTGSHVYFDTCDYPAQVFSNGGKVVDSQFDGTWFSSSRISNAPNVIVNAPTPDLIRNVNFIGCTSINARGAGIQIGNASDLHITGCDIVSNGMEYYHDGLTRHPGLQILGGAAGIAVNGGRYGQSGNFDFNYQDFGISISAGASGVSINGADVHGNANGGVYDLGTGTKISACPGAASEARGSVQLLTGQSSVLVNHGLAFTPTYADIQLTPAGLLSASGLSGIYVSGTTDTAFTITANTAATSLINIVWAARVKV